MDSEVAAQGHQIAAFLWPEHRFPTALDAIISSAKGRRCRVTASRFSKNAILLDDSIEVLECFVAAFHNTTDHVLILSSGNSTGDQAFQRCRGWAVTDLVAKGCKAALRE
jgi:hypothetical protein